MNDITQSSYNEEIESLAINLVAEAMAECDNDRDEALDKIQDYFEYRYESKQDKDFVYGILLELHNNFKEEL